MYPADFSPVAIPVPPTPVWRVKHCVYNCLSEAWVTLLKIDITASNPLGSGKAAGIILFCGSTYIRQRKELIGHLKTSYQQRITAPNQGAWSLDCERENDSHSVHTNNASTPCPLPLSLTLPVMFVCSPVFSLKVKCTILPLEIQNYVFWVNIKFNLTQNIGCCWRYSIWIYQFFFWCYNIHTLKNKG